MENIVLGLVISVFVAMPIVLYVYIYRIFQSGAARKLERFLSSLNHPASEYAVFTGGHPYTWTQVSLDSIYMQLKKEGHGGGATVPYPTKPSFLLRSDEDRKSIYIVFTYKKILTGVPCSTQQSG